MRVVHSLKDLDRIGSLRKDDVVFFDLSNEVCLKYIVRDTFLSHPGNNNDRIFNLLGLNPKTFCETAYGYRPETGKWPEVKEGDFTALTNAVKMLYTEIDRRKIAPIPSKPLFKHRYRQGMHILYNNQECVISAVDPDSIWFVQVNTGILDTSPTDNPDITICKNQPSGITVPADIGKRPLYLTYCWESGKLTQLYGSIEEVQKHIDNLLPGTIVYKAVPIRVVEKTLRPINPKQS